MFERQLATHPPHGGRDGTLVGFSVSFGVHALTFGALIAGAWLSVGAIHAPARRFGPTVPPIFLERPPAAVAAPLPRSASSSRTEKERTPSEETIPQMVQPEVIPEALPSMDETEPGEDEEFREGGVPDGSPWGIPGGDPRGIPGGILDGDPNGVLGGDPEGVGRGHGAAPALDEAIPLGGEIRPPVKTHSVQPEYPEHARLARLQGNVSLEVVVDREGFVESVRVLSGNELFRRSAVEAVRQWRYRPALQNGTPVKVVMSVLVEFRLR